MHKRKKLALLALIPLVILVAWFLWYWLWNIGVVPVPPPGAGPPQGYPPFMVPNGVDIIYSPYYYENGKVYIVLGRPGGVVIAWGGSEASAANATVYPAAVEIEGKVYVITGIASKNATVKFERGGWYIYADERGGYVYDSNVGVLWCLDYRGSYPTEKGTVYVWTPGLCVLAAKYSISVYLNTGVVTVNGVPVQPAKAKAYKYGGWLATWIAVAPREGTYIIEIK